MGPDADAVATASERRSVALFGGLVIALTLLTLPWANVETVALPSIQVILATTALIGAFLTAIILFNLWSQRRAAALAILGAGYLLAGLLAATYPVFHYRAELARAAGPEPQAGHWIFELTFLCFAIALLAYVALQRFHVRWYTPRGFGFQAAAVTVVLWLGVVTLCARMEHSLPALIDPSRGFTPLGAALMAATAAANGFALWLLLSEFKGLRLLDLWLQIVALCGMLGAIFYLAPVPPHSLASYLPAAYQIIAWLCVLVVRTYEIKWLQAGVAVALSELRERESSLDFLVGQMPAVMWTLDSNLIFRSSQGAGLKKLQLESNQVVGLSLQDFLGTADHPAMQAHRQALAGIESTYESETESTLHECSVRPLTDGEGKVVGVIGLAFDVTARRQAERRVERMMHYDELTGLPNRTLLADRVQNALAQSERDGRIVAVCSLAIDQFKTISDALGTSAGDRLLCGIAARLIETMREADTISRPTDDIFTVMITAESLDDIVISAQRILASFATPIHVLDTEQFLHPRIGIAVYPTDADTPDALIAGSMFAVQRAGAGEGSSFAFFRSDMQLAVLERLAQESDLRRALKNGEFTVYYQPIVNCRTGVVVGAEALSRWRHPQYGIIGADRFIPLAEEIGLISEIGEFTLREATKQARIWRDIGATISVTVNLAAKQCQSSLTPALVAAALEESGLPASALQLEITESAMMDDPVAAIGVLGEIRAMGIRLSVDDFGTGYSSLSYLKRFPVDTLKIDKSFIKEIETDRHIEAIVASVISLARRIGLDTVAEGVETPEQLDLVRKLGCENFQGYLYSQPIDPSAFLNKIRAAINS